jgi:hypothetical protein
VLRSGPEEHALVERLNQVLEVPTSSERHVTRVQGPLIPERYVTAVDLENDVFRPSAPQPYVSASCDNHLTSGVDAIVSADGLQITLAREVVRIWARPRELSDV